MRNDHTTARAAVPIRDGIAVLSGYNVRIRIDRRHLAVEDGCGLERREARFSKAPSRLRRLVVLGHTGFVSLEALRWLADAKAALVVIDGDGTVIASTAPQRINDPRLRRLQALAIGTPIGVEITRELLGRKVEGQRRVLATIGALDPVKASAFDEFLGRIAEARSIEECLGAESVSAAHYFRAWESRVAARFVKRDAAAVPQHWRAFGGRSSHITGNPRTATDPVNAMLNYLYALLEAETRIALLTFGIDPGLGFAHADVSNRDALALDVMEAARPAVDSWLLDLLATRPLKVREFIEGRDGRCRLTPPLAHELAASIGRWRSVVAPIVENLVDLLGSADRQLSPLVGLAGRKAKPRLAGIAAHMPRVRIAVTVDRRRKHVSGAVPDRRCHNCGEPFRGKRCKDCGFAPVLADDTGADRQRVAAMVQARADRDWRGAADDRDFKRDILPRLQGVTLRRIMEATGLSKRFASQIRNGLAVPHHRHWEALSRLGTKDHQAVRET
jgi:CRISPR-associated endonuclease Cas1